MSDISPVAKSLLVWIHNNGDTIISSDHEALTKMAAAALFVEPPHVSAALRELIAAGYIERVSVH